jgi:hypothetical protein
MSSETNEGKIEPLQDMDLGQKLTIAGCDDSPFGIYFEHTKRDRHVHVVTDSTEPGAVSNEIIDAVFEIAALNYPSVTRILEDHGFKWGRKEDVDTK